MKKLSTAFLTTFLIAFALLTINVSAIDYALDHKGDDFWGYETIAIMIEREVVTPDADGNVQPNIPIKRAEVAAAINKTFGYTQTAPIHYIDADPADWFYRDLQIAQAAGYMLGNGDGTFRPTDNISRQELSIVVGRILALPEGGQYASDYFKDHAAIADWAIDFVGAMAREGIFLGYEDGEFRPKNNVTRAESYAVMLRSLKTLTVKNNGKLGAFSAAVTGNVRDTEYLDLTVANAGVTVENVTVHGDLIIDPAVAYGNVILNNVRVTGVTYIRGGGSASVTANRCSLRDVVIHSKYNTHFILSGTEAGDSVGKIITLSSSSVDNRHTRLRPNITVADGLYLNSAVNITGAAGIIKVDSSTNINFNGNARELNITEYAPSAKLNLQKGAIIDAFYADAPSITVSGEGVISVATLSYRAQNTVLNTDVSNIISETAGGAQVTLVNFQSLTTSGTAGSSTSLTAVFDREIAGGLSSSDITVRGATLVSVTGSGRNYTITVSNVSASGVAVTVKKSGYYVTNATRSVTALIINFTNLTANGSVNAAGTVTSSTTQLTLTFDSEIAGGLSASDVAVTSVSNSSSAATVIAVYRSGSNSREYYVDIASISVPDNTEVRVTVTKAGYVFNGLNNTPSRLVRLRKLPDISFVSLTANGLPSGTSGTPTETTTILTLTFDRSVPDLTVNDITVTGATKGALTQHSTDGRIYYLSISQITVADTGYVRVAVTRPNFYITPSYREVPVRRTPDNQVAFTNLEMNALGTQLTVTFDKPVSGLVAGNFTVAYTAVSGGTAYATVTALTQSGANSNVYILSITNYANPNSKITVTVNMTGFIFNPIFREVQPPFTAVTSINITSSTVMRLGTELQIIAVVTPATATNQTIVWSVVSSTAAGATVNSSTGRLSATGTGTIRVRATIADGRATSGSNRDFTHEFDVAVRIQPTIASANNTNAQQGAAATFQVTVTAESTAPITYSLSGAPSGVSINSSSGLITIAATTAAGTHSFTITASNGTIDATQTFILTVGAANVPVEEVRLNPDALVLTVGQPASTLTATVYPTTATNKNVTWISSDPTVATVNNGVVTAAGVGIATITVKTNDGNFTATCSVTVTAAVDKTVLINKITDAETALNGAVTSLDGTDVDPTQYWVTQTVKNTLIAEIYTAQGVNNNPSATQSVVDAAVTDLTAAITTFNSLKQQGTKPE